MKINLNINLEANDKIFEFIKTVEKGVMAQNVWKPNILDNNNEDDGIKIQDNLSDNGFEQNQTAEKFLSQKITESSNLISKSLVDKSVEKIFNASSQNIISKQKNSNEILKFYSDKIFENNNKSLFDTHNSLKNEFFKEKIVSSDSKNPEIFEKNKINTLNKSFFQKIKNEKISDGDNLYDFQFSMDKYEKTNKNLFTNDENNISEIQNINETYNQISESNSQNTNNFYNNFVINCSQEEIKNGNFSETLTNCIEKSLLTATNKNERSYIYG